ncbi:MAG: ABC transporter substrate-binding protein [Lautropia sp.]|nr:ABC transporter substrate-binding protein [Lautropia sp.]
MTGVRAAGSPYSRRQTLALGSGLALGAWLPGRARAGQDSPAQIERLPGGGEVMRQGEHGGAQVTATAGRSTSRKIPRVVLAGPYATVSNPLIRIVDSGALKDVAEEVSFVSWNSPDQLRAMAISGQADFIAMPSNVAANLYNRGVKLRLMNIGIWGILSVLCRDENIRTMADLKGQEVVMPFRADMPDVIFRVVARELGIDVDRDMRLRYVASPLDAMQLLITRRADNALLAEPAASVGLRKTKSFPVSVVAPELHRGVDMQAEWGRAFKRPPRIPQAGIVMMGRHLDDPVLAERFQQACTEALQWCENNADACGEAVARRVEMLTPEGVADAIRLDQAEIVSAEAAEPELRFFYERLLQYQPGLIGGKLPAADFYERPA